MKNKKIKACKDNIYFDYFEYDDINNGKYRFNAATVGLVQRAVWRNGGGKCKLER